MIEYQQNADHKPIGIRWNLFGMMQTYFLESDPVSLMLGPSNHQLGKDLDQLIGTSMAVACQVFESPPVATASRPYYAD